MFHLAQGAGGADQRHGRLTVIARCEKTIQSLLGFGRIARAQLVLNHPADLALQGYPGRAC